MNFIAESLEEEDIENENEVSQQVIKPVPGGPFSALISSMWPQNILNKIAKVC